MAWDVLYTDAFERFMLQLGETAQVAVLADIEVLGVMGPSLGRPRVDAVKGSRYPNMKEGPASMASLPDILCVRSIAPGGPFVWSKKGWCRGQAILQGYAANR